MTYPPTRGEPTIETDSIAPCQGVRSLFWLHTPLLGKKKDIETDSHPTIKYAIGGRYNYPISSGADIALNQTRDAKEVQISYSTLVSALTRPGPARHHH